jgi:chromosome segregation ATPase
LGIILSAPFQGNIKQKSTNKRIFLGKSCYNYSKLALSKVRNRERLNALESDAVDLSSSLVDSIREIQGISTKRSTFDQNLLKINKQIGNEIIGQKSGLTDISSIQKQINKNQNLIEKSQKTANSLTNSLSVAEKRRVDFANNYAKEINEQKKIQNKLLEDSEKGLGFDKEAYDLSVEKQFQQERNLENVTKNLSNTAKQAVFSKQNLDILKEQNEERKKELEFEEKVNKNLGITGNLLKGTEGFLNKMGLGALSIAIEFDEINKEVEKFARELEDIEPNLSEAEKKQRVMNKSFELMGKSLTKALNDPLVSASILLKVVSSLAGKIAEGFQRSQVNTGILAKNLNEEYLKNVFPAKLNSKLKQCIIGNLRLV